MNITNNIKYALLIPVLFGCQSFSSLGDMEGLDCDKKSDVRLCDTNSCTGSQVCGEKRVWESCVCPNETGGSGGELSGVGGGHSGGSNTGSGGEKNSSGGSLTGTGGNSETGGVGGVGGNKNTGGTQSGGENSGGSQNSGGLQNSGGAQSGGGSGGVITCIPKECDDLTDGELDSWCGTFDNGCNGTVECGCSNHYGCGMGYPKDAYEDFPIELPGTPNRCGGGCVKVRTIVTSEEACPNSSDNLYACMFEYIPASVFSDPQQVFEITGLSNCTVSESAYVNENVGQLCCD